MDEQRNARQSLWMLLASFLFAAMGVCVKLAAQRYSAAEIVFYRSVVSLLVMLVIVRAQQLPLRSKYWRLQLFRGFSGFVSLLLYFYAITMLPLAAAVTLNYTSPLFLVFYLAAFGGLSLRPEMLGVLISGFIGVVWLLQPVISPEDWLGSALGLGSGILAGLAYFNVRALGERGEPESRTVFYFAFVSAIGAGLWMLLFSFHEIDFAGALLMLGVGLFATLAQLAMTRSYRRGDPLVSASLAYTAVLFASIFGVMFFGEVLTGEAFLAMVLIAASGVAATRLSSPRPINPGEQD